MSMRNTYRLALDAAFESSPSPKGLSIIDGVLNDRPIILYGAGECSHWFHEIAMKRHGCRPVAVIDRRFTDDGNWHGIPGYPTDNLPLDARTRQDARVVICIGDRALHDDIRATLATVGLHDVVSLQDIYEIHNPFAAPPEAEQQGRAFFDEHRATILSALELFGDAQSRDVFLSVLRTHMHRRPEAIPQRPREEQYFPRDVPLDRGHEHYVCCGAYDGDTIRLLHATHGKVRTIACFEPEPHIYRRLSAYIENTGDNLADHILTWPCAVSGSDGLKPFHSGDGLGSRLSSTGTGLAQCITLDQALPRMNPTFISMDVEGAEPEVLKGAENLLRRCTPDLGVCVYHSVSHLWEIPRQLADLDLGYRFYLRNYTGFCIETVLYATRSDKAPDALPKHPA